ncbi:MAG: glycosyltransferase family 2 protein [Rhodanobacteraceae bacterium]|nr:glycosyltransferase family 2 protein [Rhodanobacteraceae bacterium]MBL0039668.1 glycosyltransferase family 2 protein [Xanthomonadales bacterium]
MSTESAPSRDATQRLCILVPVFNEAPVLRLLMPRLDAALATIDAAVSVLFIDDGSTDATPHELAAIANNDARVSVLRLTRNFGKEAAMTAGLDHANADAVVILDADLQDPPEVIREFWARFEQGADVVYGVRISRAGESWLKRFTAATFYRLIDRLSDTPIPRDTGDFRLLSRRAVDALKQVRERHRFMKGLFGWVGFTQVPVHYHREPRAAGTSKFNFWKLWNFALEGITSFSTVPLRIATWIGLLTALVAFVYGAVIIAKTLIYGEPVRGYPSLMSVVLFLGGVQLVALGIIGEYLGRMYEESKRRPLYLIGDSIRIATVSRSD